MKAETINPFVVVLHLSDQEVHTYGHTWYTLVKSVRSDCDYLDIDQHTEKSLLEHIRKATEQARPFVLMADVSRAAEVPAGMGMLADTMLRHSTHCYAVLKGDHELIKKWLTPLKDHLTIYTSEEELKVRLKNLIGI